jgi:hypothetical protein
MRNLTAEEIYRELKKLKFERMLKESLSINIFGSPGIYAYMRNRDTTEDIGKVETKKTE